MAFQTRARLPATGKADDMTLARLKQISAAAAARQAGTDVASVTPGRAAAPDTARRQTHEPGSEFKDCAECPAMIALPPGSFTMGSPISESGRDRDEGPEHRVTIPNALAVGKYEVTFAEWDACVADGGCKGYQPPDEGWGRGNHPVVNVSWTDAQSYIQWLRNKTRQPYRLLSEAEWEYAARANTVSAYYWGARAGTTSARFNGSTIPVGSFAPARPSPASGTVPVGSYAPNSFGLYDMSGNVSEWAEDCLNRNYDGAPDNGSTWKTGNCDLRALRGGAWNSGSDNLRSANRDWDAIGFRVNRNGFRVARGL
jgi:formylglycine-generating enzyme required for sulfatase activity